jgi:hypothetical protein
MLKISNNVFKILMIKLIIEYAQNVMENWLKDKEVMENS